MHAHAQKAAGAGPAEHEHGHQHNHGEKATSARMTWPGGRRHGGRRRGLALPGTGSLCLPLLRVGRRVSSALYMTEISVVSRAEPSTHELANPHLSREATCCGGEVQTYEQTEDVFGRVTLLDLLDTVTLFLLAPLLAHRRLLSSVLCVKHFIRSRPKPLAGKGGGAGGRLRLEAGHRRSWLSAPRLLSSSSASRLSSLEVL